jgi:hypothetical protein
MSLRTAAWTAAVVLGAVVLALAWALGGGVAGLAYAGAYVLATAPGWPIGWRLFGRDHAAGWIAGALLGYTLSAWSVWAVTAIGLTWPWERVAAWAVLSVATWSTLVRRRPPLVPLPRWSAGDTLALVLVLGLVPALVGPAFLHVGQRDTDGTRQYRAYFTADVVWHAALTTELQRFSLPPRNPYTADRELHYYWTYFIVPPAIATIAPRTFGTDPFPWLLVNATGAGLLFVGVIFVFTWVARPRAAIAAASTAAVVLAASAEGAWFLWRLCRTGGPLSAVTEVNIDGVVRELFDGLTIDNLPRSLWYTPQHAAACALGLVALTVAAAPSGPAAPLAARLTAGLALAAALTISPLLGGVFAVIYGLAIAVRALMADWRTAWRVVLGHAVVAIPAAAGVAALLGASMVEGAGGALQIGFAGYARRSPIGTLALALGPVLALALPALGWLLAGARAPRPVDDPSRGVLVPAAVALVVGVLLFFFASLPDPYWVGWRGGQIMLVALPTLVGATLALGVGRWPRSTVAVLALAMAAGLPTTIIDAYNAQDTTNRQMGAGFRLTVTISPAEQDALRWLQQATRPNDVVQVDVAARGADTWTLIPTFAQRRMYAGLPISLLAEDEYRNRASAVAAAYGMTDAAEAWRIFKAGRVDYVYVGDAERQTHSPEALAKFDRDPDHFARVFENPAATIYEVR